MARNLLKFDNIADYRQAKRHDLTIPNISIIRNNGSLYVTGMFTDRENAEAGDILAFDTNGKMAFIKAQAYEKLSNEWTAEAIVVVPSSHTDNGKVKCMSLKTMSCSDPENGNVNNEEIMWGADGVQPGNNKGAVAILPYNQPLMGNLTIMSAPRTVLPSDVDYDTDGAFYEDATNHTSFVEDVECKYDPNVTAKTVISPSPYDADENKSKIYYNNDLVNNVLRNLDGETQTNNVIDQLDEECLEQTLYATPVVNAQKAQKDINEAEISDPKKGGTEEPSSSNGAYTTPNYPAFICCKRFHTNNIDDWYLPSVGEIGYLITRKGRIQKAMEAIGDTFTLKGKIWTSTPADNQQSWCCDLDDNSISCGVEYMGNSIDIKRSNAFAVVAFTEV